MFVLLFTSLLIPHRVGRWL